MSKRRGALRIGVLLTLLAARSWGADQLLTGSKLYIRNTPGDPTQSRLIHVARDASLTIGGPSSAGDPQCVAPGGGGTSRLRILAAGGAGDTIIPLPCGGWTTTGLSYRYSDPSGATCKLVLVRGGALGKAVCKGAQVAIDVGAGMSPVGVELTLNTERYCTEFGGNVRRDGSDDRVLLRKNAAPPAGCPTTSTVTSTTSTTSTTIAPPPCAPGPACGSSCADPECYVHYDPDPPDYVCVSNGTCNHQACSEDAHCGGGRVCIVTTISVCCSPCP